MAGQLTIDTLKASSGVLATQNGMTGIAKAWVNLSYNGSTYTTNGFNVSSVTVNSGGDYTVNLSTAMPNTTYSIVGNFGYFYGNGTAGNTSGWLQLADGITPRTTTAFRIKTWYVGSGTNGWGVGAADVTNVCVFSA